MLIKSSPSFWLSVALSGYCAVTLAVPGTTSVRPTIPIVIDPTRPSQKQLLEPEFRSTKPAEDIEVPSSSEAEEKAKTKVKAQLVLKKIVFEGNTAIETDELDKVAAPFLDRPINAQGLEELRQEITQRYVTDGYINSGAIMPRQKISDGVLRLKIIEGKLAEIRQTEYQCQWSEASFFELEDDSLQYQKGNCDIFSLGVPGVNLFAIKGKWTQIPDDSWRGLRQAYVNDRLRVGAGEPLDMDGVKEHYQYLLNDPLIERLNSKLLAGKKAGESDLAVRVTRARPYQLTLGYDNYTTPSVGGFAEHISGYVRNLTGLGERIDSSVTKSKGAFGYDAGVDVPLNAYDTHATFRYSNTSSTIVEIPIDTLDISSRSTAFEGGLSHPLYRRPGLDLTAGVNFSVRQSDTNSSNSRISFIDGLSNAENHNQVSVLRMWQQFVYQGDGNAFVLRSTFNKGLDVLGATVQRDKFIQSDKISKPIYYQGKYLQGGEFFSWLGQSQFSQRLFDNGTHLLIKANAQFANNPLLPLERFGVGGAYTVRGYRESYYVSDNGFNVQMEFHIPIYPLQGADPKAKHTLQLVPFMDYGGAWNNPTHFNRHPDGDYLHSLGVGLNWHFHKLDAEFYWAHDLCNLKPVNVNFPSIQDDGIHFKVSLNAF